MQIGGGRLWLRTRPAINWKSGSPGIAITIADTGTGMDSKTIKHIFDAFFSTKGTTGTGLGLWICREILTKHQGTIRVHSRQQQPPGTVFRVFLPLEAEYLEQTDAAEVHASI